MSTTHANPELERAIIGALLDASGRLVRSDIATLLALMGLGHDDFTDALSRHAFVALTSIADRSGECSPLAVWGAVRGRKGIPQDALTLLEAAKGSNLLRKEEALQHAATVRRLASLRRLQEFHRQQLAALENHGANPDSAALALETYARTLASASDADETGEGDVTSLMDTWDASIAGTYEPLMSTGVEVLDEHIGGWERNLNLVGGLPSVGKSSLMAEVIGNQLKAGRTVGLFGLEEGTQWLLNRHIAREVGLTLREVGRTRLREEQQVALAESMGEWQNRLRRLYVYRRGGITTSQMVAVAKRWSVAHGVECIYVDHGGEVAHEGGGAGSRERHDLATAATYRAMRNLAINHRLPVVILSHFNREAYDGRPTLKSFAHTEEVGRMASTALGLWQRHPGELLCEVVKARNGRRGQTLWLERRETAGLVQSKGGGEIDWEAQRQAEEETRAGEQEARRSSRKARAGGLFT